MFPVFLFFSRIPDSLFNDHNSLHLENLFVQIFTILKEFVSKIEICFSRTESPDPDWFDESQTSVYEKLQTDERFLDSFRRSMGYVKLLAELDLLKVNIGI